MQQNCCAWGLEASGQLSQVRKRITGQEGKMQSLKDQVREPASGESDHRWSL